MSLHVSSDWLLRSIDGELDADALETVERHVAACAECRVRRQSMLAVSGALESHGAALGEAAPRQGGRERLSTALEAAGLPHRRSKWAPLLAAAAVLLSVAVLRTPAFRPGVPPPRPAVTPPSPLTAGFIALPYSDENLSAEGAVAVEVELPRTALMLAGLPAAGGHSGDRVRAQVLVGADGLVRAIRFLN